jgi:hypothetical protein
MPYIVNLNERDVKSYKKILDYIGLLEKSLKVKSKIYVYTGNLKEISKKLNSCLLSFYNISVETGLGLDNQGISEILLVTSDCFYINSVKLHRKQLK